MRGYQAGTEEDPARRARSASSVPARRPRPGSKLAIDYRYVTGEYNYYDPDATQGEATLEVALDQVAAGLEYPIAVPVDGLVQPPDIEITAINGVVLTLTAVARVGRRPGARLADDQPGRVPRVRAHRRRRR